MNLKPFSNKRVIDLQHLTNRGDHVTHGDVIIYRIDESDLPINFADLPEVEGGLLALGEHSGHAHKLFEGDFVPEEKRPQLVLVEGNKDIDTSNKYSLRTTAKNEMFLVVKETALLRHQEHRPFRIYPGNYEIGIQVERNPYDDQIRALRD